MQTIMLLILFLLFCIACFIVVWVILDNKQWKTKLKKSETEREGEEEEYSKREEILRGRYEYRICELAELAKKVQLENVSLKKQKETLEKELSQKTQLIEQLKSVSISERAFLIDLDD